MPDSTAADIAQARAHSDLLFDLVAPETLYTRPVPDRHRLIFYLGHLEAFDWNLLCRYALDVPSFHPAFDRLFAFGIDPEPGKAPADTPADWPTVDEVRSYARRVREIVDARLGDTPQQVREVALEHRLMHIETFAYLLHNLPAHDKRGTATETAPAALTVEHRMIEIPAGRVTLGRKRRDGFGQDNEFDECTADVPAFSIGRYKVSNGQYLDFVHAGGSVPHFWTGSEGDWLLRCMFGDIPLPLDWPVWVTHEQAAAYAAWAGASLPTEAQWQRAAYGFGEDEQQQDAPSAGNFDFRRWDPEPVVCGGKSPFGAVQMAGNGWEWTSSPFEPFPGFEPFPFYPGYSADFFDGAHYVMKGGSPRTAARLLRPTFRNWFRPNYPYVYAGFRTVEN